MKIVCLKAANVLALFRVAVRLTICLRMLEIPLRVPTNCRGVKTFKIMHYVILFYIFFEVAISQKPKNSFISFI